MRPRGCAWAWLAALVFVSLTAAPVAPADPSGEAVVSLGPAPMSFAELARHLSAAGRSVRLGPALEHRAAYVYLKDRSWQQARDLLAESLDVRFEEKGAGAGPGIVWEMRADPAVEEREGRWRRQLSANLHRDIRGQLARWKQEATPFRHFISDLPPARRTEDARRVLEELRPLNQLREEHGGLPAAEMRRYQELQKQLEFLDGVWMNGTAERWLAVTWLETALRHAPPDLVRSREVVLQAGDVGQLPVDLAQPYLEAERSRDPRYEAGSYRAFEGRLSFAREPSGISLTPSLLFLPDEGPALPLRCMPPVMGMVTPVPRTSERLADVVFRGRGDLGSTDYPPLDGLAERALKWLREEQQATASFLASEPARRPFRSDPLMPLTSFSQALEAWSRQLDHETVMELFPVAEEMGAAFLNVSADSLALTGKEITLGPFVEKLGWTTRERGGVLMVRNPLAFVDRPRPFPLPGFLRLERRVREQRAALAVARPDPPPAAQPVPLDRAAYEDLAEYYRDTLESGGPNWQDRESLLTAYRGILIMRLDPGWSAFFVWERLPLAQRARLVASQDTGSATFPLSPLALADRQRILRQQLSVSDLPATSLDYPARLAGSYVLQVTWRREQSPEGAALVACRLVDGAPDHARAMPPVQAAVTFTWNPDAGSRAGPSGAPAPGR